MDILIINPGKIRHDYITEHLGIASLKAYASLKGFVAETLDMAIEGMSVREGIKKIISLQPKSVGVSLLEDSKRKGLSLIQELRRSDYDGTIIVGGYFATFSSQEILQDFPEIDFVVRGEGELTLVELLNTLFHQRECSFKGIQGLSFRENGQIVENPSRPLINDLDILPPVDRKYANCVLNRGSRLRIYGTRGCWGRCTFCDIIKLYGCSPGRVWRYRTVTNLVDEIESLVKHFSTDYFVFNDDQFIIKGVKGWQRAEEFASELERRKLNIQFELMCRADTIHRATLNRLKSAGLRRVFLGLESFDEKQLKRLGKRVSVGQNLKALITLYQLKIDVIASVILADAFTTLSDLVKQFIFLFEVRRRYFNSPNCQISVNKKIELYRGSDIYKDYKKKGLLKKDHYLKECKYKLHFWAHVRLSLFSIETFLTRVILNPIQFLNYLKKVFHWQFKQIKNDVLFSKS
jgi:anaerobic magnesium-protoporphyrin IX monomethyl ester cyclase